MRKILVATLALCGFFSIAVSADDAKVCTSPDTSIDNASVFDCGTDKGTISELAKRGWDIDHVIATPKGTTIIISD